LSEICQSKDLLCGIFCSVQHLSVSSPLDVSFIFLGSHIRTIFSTSFSLSIYRSLCIFHRSFCSSPRSFCIFYGSLSITLRSPWVSGIFLGFSNRKILSVSSRFIPLNHLEITPDFTVLLPDLLHFHRIPCISPTRRSLTIFHRSLRTQPGSHCISPESFVRSSRRLILLPDLPTLPFWFFHLRSTLYLPRILLHLLSVRVFQFHLVLSIYRSLCVFHRSSCISLDTPIAPPDLYISSTDLSVSHRDHLVFLVSSLDFLFTRFCPFCLVSSL
jgi:hypothetical protein